MCSKGLRAMVSAASEIVRLRALIGDLGLSITMPIDFLFCDNQKECESNRL